MAGNNMRKKCSGSYHDLATRGKRRRIYHKYFVEENTNTKISENNIRFKMVDDKIYFQENSVELRKKL